MYLIVLLGLLISLTHAQDYLLQSAFNGGPTFLDNFEFWTSWDPTFGYVHYVDQATAQQYYMINTTNSSVSFGVDTTQVLNPSANLGRPSIRLTTIQTWTHGLFILDLAHLPAATCGSWPSFWSLGETGTWPQSGEIDIIELVNLGPNNLMSLHTMPGCTIAGTDEMGTLLTSDCGLAGGITGCTVEATSPYNTADAFNANGGGVYVMEWTSTAIQIWIFPRNAIPESITAGSPDVTTFGVPSANFQGSCDIDAYFYNHNLIFNIDFCGEWAGPTFYEACPDLDPSNSWQSCNDFVALNPGAFYETYWEVNYLHVYQAASGTFPTSTSSLSSVIPAISTSSLSTALSNAQGRSSTPTQSIAGTTADITTGSFHATSSVLSVLSSLSVSSVSASSVSASLASVAATTPPISTSLVSSSVVSAPTSSSIIGVPSSQSSPATLAASTTEPFASSPATPTTSFSSALPCTEAVCTVLTTAVVAQTVTAVLPKLKHREVDLYASDPSNRLRHLGSTGESGRLRPTGLLDSANDQYRVTQAGYTEHPMQTSSPDHIAMKMITVSNPSPTISGSHSHVSSPVFGSALKVVVAFTFLAAVL